MNNIQRIEDLLNRYWDGETSLEEERELKAYFNSDDIAEQFRSVAPLFRAFREEQTVQLSQQTPIAPMRPVMYRTWPQLAVAASVALLIVAGMWLFFHGSTVVPGPATAQLVAPVPQPDTQMVNVAPPNTALMAQKTSKTNTNPSLKKKNSRKKPRQMDTDEETELAMQEVKAALAILTSKLSKGRREAAKGAVHVEHLDRVFKKKEG
jgi:hypothetical protein